LPLRSSRAPRQSSQHRWVLLLCFFVFSSIVHCMSSVKGHQGRTHNTGGETHCGTNLISLQTHGCLAASDIELILSWPPAPWHHTNATTLLCCCQLLTLTSLTRSCSPPLFPVRPPPPPTHPHTHTQRLATPEFTPGLVLTVYTPTDEECG
jgi:hypothetical protein